MNYARAKKKLEQAMKLVEEKWQQLQDDLPEGKRERYNFVQEVINEYFIQLAFEEENILRQTIEIIKKEWQRVHRPLLEGDYNEFVLDVKKEYFSTLTCNRKLRDIHDKSFICPVCKKRSWL